MKKSHAQWIKSAKGIGWSQLAREALELGQTVTYDSTNVTWNVIEDMLNEMYSEENMKRRKKKAKRQREQLEFIFNPHY